MSALFFVLSTSVAAANRKDATRSRRIYVGYGMGARGAVAVVDPATMERMEEFKVGSHPESFQLEKEGSRIFVNLPDQESIGVIDQKTGMVTKWRIPGYTNSHALAFDEVSYRLFVASLQPGRLTVVDAEWGRVVATVPRVLGVDDIWFDSARRRIYATGAGAPSMYSKLILTATRLWRAFRSELGPAVRAFTSRRARRTACSCLA
jgi:DNA-binding beta-propeller fold protein YncE